MLGLKSMDSQLSNAVSHAFFWVLDAKIHHTWWKCFLPIFRSTFWEWVITILTLTNNFRLMDVDLGVNTCWPKVQNIERMFQCTQISVYSFWNGLEIEKSQIYTWKTPKGGIIWVFWIPSSNFDGINMYIIHHFICWLEMPYDAKKRSTDKTSLGVQKKPLVLVV